MPFKMKVGGAGDLVDVDDEVRGICQQVKAELQQKCGKDAFEIFEAISYRSQLVAGTNYFVKIKIGSGGECIHARIYKTLPHMGGNVEVHSVQTGRNVDDDVEYF